jgi:hypothetical protein
VVEPPPNAQPPDIVTNAATLFGDCELLQDPTCDAGLPSSTNVLPLKIARPYNGANPNLTEVPPLQVISNGSSVLVSEAIGVPSTVDNYHQSSFKAVIEPATHGGCPDCAHMHWRWSSIADPNNTFLVSIGFVSPNFTDGNYHGKPIIPDNSHQDVDVAIAAVNLVQSEIHPLDYTTIMTGRSINPTDSRSTGPVFWYAGTGHSPSDSFLTHGGFFSSTGALHAILNMKATPIAGTSPQQFLIDFDILQPLLNTVNLQSDVQWFIQSNDPGGTFEVSAGVLPPKVPLFVTSPPDPTHVETIYTVGTNSSAVLSVSALASGNGLQYQNQIHVP